MAWTGPAARQSHENELRSTLCSGWLNPRVKQHTQLGSGQTALHFLDVKQVAHGHTRLGFHLCQPCLLTWQTFEHVMDQWDMEIINGLNPQCGKLSRPFLKRSAGILLALSFVLYPRLIQFCHLSVLNYAILVVPILTRHHTIFWLDRYIYIIHTLSNHAPTQFQQHSAVTIFQATSSPDASHS